MTFYGLEYTLENGSKIGDVVVLGKPLREWTVSEIGNSYSDYGDWASEVFSKINVGNDLDEIISTEFNTEYYLVRNSYVTAERIASRTEEFQRNVAMITCKPLEQITVLNLFEMSHPGWELDYSYAVVRVEDKIVYAGTDHGSPRLFTKEEIRRERDARAKELAAIDAALEIE